MKMPELKDIYNCARCGEDHKRLCFYEFKHPPDGWTHYAECPETYQPILMVFDK